MVFCTLFPGVATCYFRINRLLCAHLFEFLLDSISCDVRDLFLEGQHDHVFLYPREIEECKKRLLPLLDTMPEAERSFFTAQAEFYFKHCNDIHVR